MKINLLPGIPDDDNRDYLPEYLKDSEIVVNENGNNSQVYPKRLEEKKGALVDEFVDTWYQYVPESYNSEKKTPVVFSMHGGLMTGWAQAVYTSWTHIADREGFICIFPNAQLRRFWTIECEDKLYKELSAPNEEGIYMNPVPPIEENHDVLVVFALIEKLKKEYNIDEERIYMQGMSCGNAMTTMMARHFGNKFAAMEGSAGPGTMGLMFREDGTPNNDAGPLPVLQTRMENDGTPPGSTDSPLDIVAGNRDYWLIVNQCKELPVIKLDGENNYAFYKGKKADYIFRDVKNRDHGQTFDDAEICWDYLFSGTRRKADGSIEYMETIEKREGDRINYAVEADSRYAWVNNKKTKLSAPTFEWKKLKYHGLGGDALVRAIYTMVPVTDLVEAFGGSVICEAGKIYANMKNGKKLQFARGCIGCTINDHVRSMLIEAVERENVLFISAEWFVAEVMGLQYSKCGSMIYATDHYGVLSAHMERLLHDILKSDDQ